MLGLRYSPLVLSLLLLTASGCGAQTVSVSTAEAAEAGVRTAIVNTEGKTIGEASFAEEPGGVRIRLQLKGIPAGTHGFHVHETGKCSPPDFTSAGPHFNPQGKKHGLLSLAGPHAGDLPNLVAGADGNVTAEWLASGLTLAQGQPNSLRKPGGTAIVIHEKADDGMTDPAGDSGARIACGVIGE